MLQDTLPRNAALTIFEVSVDRHFDLWLVGVVGVDGDLALDVSERLGGRKLSDDVRDLQSRTFLSGSVTRRM